MSNQLSTKTEIHFNLSRMLSVNSLHFFDFSNLVPRVSLLPAPARVRETLVGAGHVTAHDKLLPSRGTLAQLFYSQRADERFSSGCDLSKRNARDLAQFHAVCKNRILSTI